VGELQFVLMEEA